MICVSNIRQSYAPNNFGNFINKKTLHFYTFQAVIFGTSIHDISMDIFMKVLKVLLPGSLT